MTWAIFMRFEMRKEFTFIALSWAHQPLCSNWKLSFLVKTCKNYPNIQRRWWDHPRRPRGYSGLLVVAMHFRASDIFGAIVYFKGWRASGHFFLPNEFQKWSKSVPLIGQKKFLSGQSTRRSSWVILSTSYTKWFSSSIDIVAWPLQREDSR